jgi:hypothetical protein
VFLQEQIKGIIIIVGYSIRVVPARKKGYFVRTRAESDQKEGAQASAKAKPAASRERESLLPGLLVPRFDVPRVASPPKTTLLLLRDSSTADMTTVILSVWMTDCFLMMTLFFLKSLVSRRCVGFSIRMVPARKKRSHCANAGMRAGRKRARKHQRQRVLRNRPAFRRARHTSSHISAEKDSIVPQNHHADSKLPALFASLSDYDGA